MNRQDLIAMYQDLYMHAKSDSVEHFAYGYIHTLLSGSKELSWVRKQLMHACKTSRGLEHDITPHHEYETNGAYMTIKASIYEQALERLSLLELPGCVSCNSVEQSTESGLHTKVLLLAG